eukprot:763587-Hanusia_phi.AAC.1
MTTERQLVQENVSRGKKSIVMSRSPLQERVFYIVELIFISIIMNMVFNGVHMGKVSIQPLASVCHLKHMEHIKHNILEQVDTSHQAHTFVYRHQPARQPLNIQRRIDLRLVHHHNDPDMTRGEEDEGKEGLVSEASQSAV